MIEPSVIAGVSGAIERVRWSMPGVPPPKGRCAPRNAGGLDQCVRFSYGAPIKNFCEQIF